MEKVRIGKFIADCGMASRRVAENLIAAGRVSVNGKKIDSPVVFVDDTDVVMIGDRRACPRTETKLYMFNKPINTMTTTSDPAGRRTVYDVLPMGYKNLKYVGRLDFRTTGLLLMTNDGELARKLTLPESEIPRVYIATVNTSDLSGLDNARRGMTIDNVEYRPMDIAVISKTPNSATLRVQVIEGKKNEVRVVLRECGAPVRKLHRVSFGPIKLGTLATGKICEVPQKTIDALLKSL